MLEIKKINSPKITSGFTLLEILLVVGIIAILAGIVIVAINPGRQLAMARNTERRSDLKQINNALQQYYIDHREYPGNLSDALTDICDTGDMATSSVPSGYCNGRINLSVLVPTYITAIPKDPQATTTASAGYQVIRHSSGGRIGLLAPGELDQNININVPPEEVVDLCGVSGDATDPDCWSIATSSLSWGPRGVVTNVSSTTDGATNTATLAGLADNYPAADYCAGLEEGGHSNWYLPALQQLINGLTEYESQYATDPTWGGFVEDYNYWSSTEHSTSPQNEDYALFAVSYGGNYLFNFWETKNETYILVRCLR